MENNLKKLIGQKVTSSLSGGAAGSILYVTVEDDSYLAFWCTWRIEKGKEVIVTSSDTTQVPNGMIQEKTPVLENNCILEINLSPQYDLNIVLENNYMLRVFCDIAHSRNDYPENWELGLPKENKVIEVSNHYEIKESTYSD